MTSIDLEPEELKLIRVALRRHISDLNEAHEHLTDGNQSLNKAMIIENRDYKFKVETLLRKINE